MNRKKIARHIAFDCLSRQDHRFRFSFTYDDIVSQLDSDIKDNASSTRVSMTDFDEASNTYTFESDTGRTTTIQVDPRYDVEDLGDGADVLITCSCPFWQFYGPEYHGDQNDYLYEDPRGTASKPDENDPDMNNFVCKHAYKALESLL
jgi:hypothetical protein